MNKLINIWADVADNSADMSSDILIRVVTVERNGKKEQYMVPICEFKEMIKKEGTLKPAYIMGIDKDKKPFLIVKKS